MKEVLNMNQLKKNQDNLYCLNVGCGKNYLADWNNIDLVGSKDVIQYNVSQGIPFPNNVFDVVYSSHVIEHLTYDAGVKFIQECYRILKNGGVLRLLTPDLERMIKEYMKNLEFWSKDKTDKNRQRYEWIMMEMFDQMIREKSGGMMLEKINAGDIDLEYVLERTGDELAPYLGNKDQKESQNIKKIPINRLGMGLIKIKNKLKKLIKITKKYKCFSTIGENHKWYYDRVSLEHLIKHIGFHNYTVVDYKTSLITSWNRMNLDMSQMGDFPRKPDSIVVEARK